MIRRPMDDDLPRAGCSNPKCRGCNNRREEVYLTVLEHWYDFTPRERVMLEGIVRQMPPRERTP